MSARTLEDLFHDELEALTDIERRYRSALARCAGTVKAKPTLSSFLLRELARNDCERLSRFLPVIPMARACNDELGEIIFTRQWNTDSDLFENLDQYLNYKIVAYGSLEAFAARLDRPEIQSALAQIREDKERAQEELWVVREELFKNEIFSERAIDPLAARVDNPAQESPENESGAATSASYRLVTGAYRDMRRALSELAGAVFTPPSLKSA